MLLEFSHIIAFSALFVSGLFDVFSEKGDVPSVFSVVAVVAGILLHIGYAWSISSFTPIFWMLGVGLVFSLYGWVAYWLGMWGGADALAMTVLGFAAPYSVSGPGFIHGLSLFVNIFVVSAVYAVLFAFYRFLKSKELRLGFFSSLRENKLVVGGELLLVGLVSVFQSSIVYSLVSFFVLSVLVLLFHLTRVLEDVEMSTEVSIGDVEVGDIIDTKGLDLGRSRERNLVGKIFQSLDGFLNGLLSRSRFSVVEERMGYSEIVGLTEDELNYLKDQGVESLSVKEGLRLVPVFPAALVLTDAGVTIFTYFTLF